MSSTKLHSFWEKVFFRYDYSFRCTSPCISSQATSPSPARDGSPSRDYPKPWMSGARYFQLVSTLFVDAGFAIALPAAGTPAGQTSLHPNLLPILFPSYFLVS